jgi:hypothetical protein
MVESQSGDSSLATIRSRSPGMSMPGMCRQQAWQAEHEQVVRW